MVSMPALSTGSVLRQECAHGMFCFAAGPVSTEKPLFVQGAVSA